MRRDVFGLPLALLLCAAVAVAMLPAAQAQEDEQDGVEPEDVPVEDPLAPPAMPRTAPGMVDLFGDAYWYLPYAVTDEEMGLAFVDAYAEELMDGDREMPDSLEVPEGMGAGGSDRIYRLQPGVTDMFIQDINNPAATAVSTSEIPVIVAQPEPGAAGANVLYLDGHVEFVRWGEFPVTRDFIGALAELDPPEYAEEDDEAEGS